jgi:16S rRNA (guanine966-N2)-methyltransferase
MALRVIAGDLRGRKLRSVSGRKTRPTANRTREAVFNILASQIAGARVLDLFAGTGAFGIEALSRKAETAVFVDHDRDSISIIHANIRTLSLESRTVVIRWDLVKNLNCLQSPDIAFDLVFMDPPYERKLIAHALENLHLSQSLSLNTKIIVEHSRKESIFIDDLPFKITDQRKYGKTLVTFLDYVL